MSSITFSFIRKYAQLFAKNHILHRWGERNLLVAATAAKVEIQRGPFADIFAVCPLAIGSNAEQQLLKPEHLGEQICWELYGSLVDGVGGIGIDFGGVAVAADGVACDIQLSKINV